MQREFEGRVDQGNEEKAGLLEEVRGLTHLNLLLDRKVQHASLIIHKQAK